MNAKPKRSTAKLASRTEPAATQLPIEADELHEPEVGAYIARNRDALIESIARSREDHARGRRSEQTVGDVFDAVRLRHKTRA